MTKRAPPENACCSSGGVGDRFAGFGVVPSAAGARLPVDGCESAVSAPVRATTTQSRRPSKARPP
jgi:hypothetical protein